MDIKVVAVENLHSDDLVDLQNDPYADPDGADPVLENELQRVESVTLEERNNCVAVAFCDFDVVGFPAGHKVRVVKA